MHKIELLKLQGQRVYLKNAGNTFHGHWTRVDLKKMGRSGMVIQKWKILLECHQLMPNSKIFKEYSNAVTSKKKSALVRASLFLRPAQNSLVIHALKVSFRLTNTFHSSNIIYKYFLYNLWLDSRIQPSFFRCSCQTHRNRIY